MKASMRALLAGIIDYAGLFPPAKLPLDAAIRNYARYRAGADRWMLGRFVCPAARLAELTPYADELFSSAAPFSFSALGRSGGDAAEFLAGARADLEAIVAFRRHCGDRVVVDAYETRLPPAVTGAAEATAVGKLLAQSADLLSGLAPPALNVSYEVAPASDWGRSWTVCIDSIATANRAASAESMSVGFKWRAGGLEAAAFPSVEQVAFIIAACRERGVAWKATAGLHDPFRHFDPNLQTAVHGFLNVFAAGVLADVCRLSEASIQAIIADDQPEHFRFNDEAFHWSDVSASAEEIAGSRKRFALSFGSCSFEEPGDHLRRLGWM